MHDYWGLAISVFIILGGMAWNNWQQNSRFDRVEIRLDRLEADLKEFYRSLGQHDAKIENLEKKQERN
jgi:hypothetical protein